MTPPDLEIGFSLPKVGGLIEAALPKLKLENESLPEPLNPLTPKSPTFPSTFSARFDTFSDSTRNQPRKKLYGPRIR